ncbi:hypothetical protein KPATCC21470_8568 [Kitasatospora purpeofusca]
MVFPTVGDGGVVVEFDGSHCHRNSSERDPRKALEIEQLRPGRTVVRVRGDPLRLTRAGDVAVPLPADPFTTAPALLRPRQKCHRVGRPAGRAAPGACRTTGTTGDGACRSPPGHAPVISHRGRTQTPSRADPARNRRGQSWSSSTTAAAGPPWPSGRREDGTSGTLAASAGSRKGARSTARRRAPLAGVRAASVAGSEKGCHSGRLSEEVMIASVAGPPPRDDGAAVQGPATARCRAHNPPGPGSRWDRACRDLRSDQRTGAHATGP